MSITKEDFQKYYDVQMSGEFNMITDYRKGINESGLSNEKYYEIIKNYNEYYDEYIKPL